MDQLTDEEVTEVLQALNSSRKTKALDQLTPKYRNKRRRAAEELVTKWNTSGIPQDVQQRLLSKNKSRLLEKLGWRSEQPDLPFGESSQDLPANLTDHDDHVPPTARNNIPLQLDEVRQRHYCITFIHSTIIF